MKASMGNRQKIIITGAVVAVLAVVGGIGFWYWSTSSQEAPTLGSQLFDKTRSTLECQVPDTNPFKDQKNPFDTIYQNPFE